MNVVLVRCGRSTAAEGNQETGASDQFPLSPQGRRAVRESAVGLACILKSAGLVASSSLMSAVETAAIIARAFGQHAIELSQLSPTSRSSHLARWLSKQTGHECIILVGHGPSMVRFATRLIGREGGFVALDPAGGCLLELDPQRHPPRATIQWLMTSRQLRRAGRKSRK